MVNKAPNVGGIILDLRLTRGMDQNELAEKTGYSQSYISRIENGGVNPSLKALRKIAKVFGVEENFFFGNNKVYSLDNDQISFGHLNKKIRGFIAKENSIPYIEFAKDLSNGGMTTEELDALRIVIKSRKRGE